MKNKKIGRFLATAAILAATPLIFTACGKDKQPPVPPVDDGQDDTPAAVEHTTVNSVEGYTLKASTTLLNSLLADEAKIADSATNLTQEQTLAVIEMVRAKTNAQAQAGVRYTNSKNELMAYTTNAGQYLKDAAGEWYYEGGASTMDVYFVGPDENGETVYRKESVAFTDPASMRVLKTSKATFLWLSMMEINTGTLSNFVAATSVADGQVTIEFGTTFLAQTKLDLAGLTFGLNEDGSIATETYTVAYLLNDDTETVYYQTVTGTYSYDATEVSKLVVRPTTDANGQPIVWTPVGE